VTKSLRIAFLVVVAALFGTAPAHADVTTQWNAIIMNCVGGPAPFGNRPGPTGLLDVAVAHAAMHDAVQAIQGRFESYHYVNPARRGMGSVDAAAAAAAYGVLAGFYGAADPCLATVTNPAVTYAGDPGLVAGHEAAAALIPLYRPSFLTANDPFFGGTAPGQWRPTIGSTQGQNLFMAETEPFTLNRQSQFRPEPPPPLQSQRYRRDYDEVKAYGALFDSSRSAEQTDLARFWTGPPGQWFGALRGIADNNLTDVGDTARLFALAALAAADSQISVYETKYHYNFWRPETAIREGSDDPNRNTEGDPTWLPFITTPAYPDHSSGANNVSGAFTTILQLFFRTDEFEFTISSPAAGLMTNPRPYTRFSDAAQEMVDVRVLQGIHFRFADEDGRQQGSLVAHWVFQKFLRALPGGQQSRRR
jgi:hypothetical protein